MMARRIAEYVLDTIIWVAVMFLSAAIMLIAGDYQ
jgi:hypothetical protein